MMLTGFSCAHASQKNLTQQNTPINDVRILIDISGSMKQNDPANLRKPALNLFVSLLPSETKAGVWTFGQWVNMLIPHGPVTKEWKNNAKQSVQKINSAGLYTNIEDAIRRSTWDWRNTSSIAGSERSLILLTDGLVDISKDEQKNHKSRNNIVRELLPQLQKSGVTIHAIALSNDSDKNLLEQLTTATGGRFETIETAKGLERLFLHLFESVAPTDSLPLKENRVKVDNSIKEMTFLVFRENTEEESSITSPSKKTYDINNQQPEMIWHREAHYDLITVKKPEAGYWEINTKADPDNRVMVVTNLKLVTSKLPSMMYAGTKQKLYVHLEDNGRHIDQKDFLHFVKATYNQVSVDDNNKEKSWKFKISDNGRRIDKKSKDGIYSIELNKSLIAGEHEIEVSVNGTTFRRHFRKQITVYDKPATATLELVNNKTIKISILPYQMLIDTNNMSVTASHKLPNGDTNKIVIEKINPSEWGYDLPTEGITGKHKVTIKIKGHNNDGNAIKSQLKTLTIMVGETNTDVSKKYNTNDKIANEIETSINSESTAPSWAMVSLKVGIFNIIIILICFMFYKYFSQIRQKLIPNLFKEAADG